MKCPCGCGMNKPDISGLEISDLEERLEKSKAAFDLVLEEAKKNTLEAIKELNNLSLMMREDNTKVRYRP